VRRLKRGMIAAICVAGSSSCNPAPTNFAGLPLETRFAFTNFSRQFYATLALRSADVNDDAAYVQVPLLAPGVTFRGNLLDFTGTGCPDAIDFRLLLYARVNDDLPIGLDPTEEIEPEPVAAGEILGIPACNVQPLETFTIVNWDADEGTARVKFAQGTLIDETIRVLGLFDNVDAAWEITGVDANLASQSPPTTADNATVAGRVTNADGSGIEGIGVLMRTRFRVRLDDADTTNDPDAGFSEPIDFITTDADGGFAFDRPAGAYEIEFFADGFVFRPTSVIVESPIETIVVVAEPL